MNSVAQGQEISQDLCPVGLLLLNQKNSLLHVFFVAYLFIAKWTEYNLSSRKQTSCMLSVVTDNVTATWTVIVMDYILRPIYGTPFHNSPEAYRCLLSSCTHTHTQTHEHTGTSNCIHTHVHPPPPTNHNPTLPTHTQWIVSYRALYNTNRSAEWIVFYSALYNTSKSTQWIVSYSALYNTSRFTQWTVTYSALYNTRRSTEWIVSYSALYNTSRSTQWIVSYSALYNTSRSLGPIFEPLYLILSVLFF